MANQKQTISLKYAVFLSLATSAIIAAASIFAISQIFVLQPNGLRILIVLGALAVVANSISAVWQNREKIENIQMLDKMIDKIRKNRHEADA